ncbi:phage portal protein [Demequina sp. SO4-18]|uniref:phage portal protein n=1 Tax=Demequina sp. SO4-18 TaxID=3401026 RepID=UPI003B59BDC7
MLTADAALTKATSLLNTLAGRRAEIDRLNSYYLGDQPLVFATDEWKKFHAKRYQGFSDNWCGVVGSAPGERTEITGFRVGKDVDPVSSDEAGLWADWERNDGPAQASQGFLASTVSKRSFALVWGDPDDEPVLTWESPSQMIVDYDVENPRKRRYALKAWTDGDMEFITLYEPEAVWKWERRAYGVTNGRTRAGLIVPGSMGANFTVRQPDTDDTWPVRNPLGVVPVVEFANRPTLGGEPMSDIAGTAAMQDAINMLWAYLFVAADYASMPGRVVTGAEPPKVPILNDAGDVIGSKPVDIDALTKGRMLWLTGQGVQIDQWDAAKLDVFLEVVNVAVRHIAAQTRTPIYLVHGELGNVNGETLTGLDAPLVAKVREAHKFYQRPTRELFALMALVRDQKALARECALGTIQWSNPEVRSDSQVSDAALKDVQVGIPLQAVLETRYGYSQPKIARILQMRDAEMGGFERMPTDPPADAPAE